MNHIPPSRAQARSARILGAFLTLAVAGLPAAAQQPRQPAHADMVPLEAWFPPPPAPPNNQNAFSFPLSQVLWTPLGPAPIVNGQTTGNLSVSGRIAGIAAHPSSASILYIAASGGGVWKTADAGASWNPVTDSQATLVSGAIALAPSNPNIVYCGTGEANNSGDSFYGRGVLKSIDGGATWNLMGGSVFNRRAIAKIAVHPTDPNTLYAAVAGAVNGLSGNYGIWKSTDGGTTWSNTTTAISSTLYYSDVVLDPTNPLIVYAAVGAYFGSTQNGVYKSVNAGATWALAGNFPSGNTTNGRICIAISRSTPQTLYSSVTNSSTAGLFKMLKSTDGGGTWADLTAAVPNYQGSQGWYDTTLIVDPTNPNIVYAAGGAGSNHIVRTTDGGTTWTAVGTGADGKGPHVDHHAIAFDAAGGLLDGNDGGIFRYTPATNLWTSLNSGLNTIQFIGIALDPTTPDIAFGGSQDNGTSRFYNSLAWQIVEGGDGGLIRFDQFSPSTVYRVSPVGSFGTGSFFRKSTNGGLSFVAAVTGLTGAASTLFYPPFFLDPATINRLFLGSNVVNVSTNGASNWTRLPGDSFTFPAGMDLVAVGPANPSIIYTSANGGVYVTTNGGGTWTQRNPAGVTDHFQQLALDPTDSNIAYLVRDRFNPNGHVFRTTNAGVTWADISSNLPDIPVTCIILDANGPGTADDVLYVGTDTGVYFSSNLGASWGRLANGLPNVRITDMELNKNLGILAAGTYGRGLWELATSARGACCLTSTYCTLKTATQCAAAAGTYRGDNSTCAAVTQAGSPVTTNSTNVPVAIPDVSTVTSTLNVASAAPVFKVTVNLSLTHTRDSDLVLTLIAPNGQSALLFNDLSQAGQNFTNTTFDDAAATAITAATAPFTGSFRPMYPLASLVGVPSNGTWTLRISDIRSSQVGTLNSWSIAITPGAAPPCNACYANCDLSTAPPILNVNDFACFLNAYAAGNTYANCDLSTAPPILNVNDFACFLNKYAAGCS